MKRPTVYLEASALWNLFYGEPGQNMVEYALKRDDVLCSSSVWSHLEIWRGIQKRINIEEISVEEGENLRRFVKLHLDGLVAKKQLIEYDVSRELVEIASDYIARYNLYASDALHLSTAAAKACSMVLVDDYHFTRLEKNIVEEIGIEIWPTSLDFHEFATKLDGAIHH